MRWHGINLEMLSMQILFKGIIPTSNAVASIESPHPFLILKMDVLWPFPIDVHKLMFLTINVDYFSKCGEVEPPNNIFKRMY